MEQGFLELSSLKKLHRRHSLWNLLKNLAYMLHNRSHDKLPALLTYLISVSASHLLLPHLHWLHQRCGCKLDLKEGKMQYKYLWAERKKSAFLQLWDIMESATFLVLLFHLYHLYLCTRPTIQIIQETSPLKIIFSTNLYHTSIIICVMLVGDWSPFLGSDYTKLILTQSRMMIVMVLKNNCRYVTNPNDENDNNKAYKSVMTRLKSDLKWSTVEKKMKKIQNAKDEFYFGF